MPTKLIIALDFADINKAQSIIEQIDPKDCILKIGNEMFTRFGPELIKELVAKRYKIFLDLKFHDIPNTVANACKSAASLGVWMMNVHALGGEKMLCAAAQAVASFGEKRPLLIAVTMLTSMSNQDLSATGIHQPLSQQVTRLSQLSFDCGLDGVVCSAHEVPSIKKDIGSRFIAVTPGVRLNENSDDDQVRIVTPQKAKENGSDYIVVGRPITQADNPKLVIAQILESIQM